MEQTRTSGGARRVAFCSFLFGTACLVAASCGFDDRGLSEPPDGHGGSGSSSGTGGKISGSGSGGAPGSGGTPAPEGGSGGTAAGGSGDHGASGGRMGSGGVPSASGGAIASGGTVGSAGQGGAGGKTAGSGGQISTGSGGRGGAAGMNTGAGGSAKGGAGGGMTSMGGASGAGGAAGPGGAGGAALPCGPKTCATGCCDGDRCVTQHTNDKCGASGAACAKCNSCFRCGNAGACEVDPMSTWKVVCVGATLASTKTNFQSWDDQFDQMGGGGPGGPGGPGNGGPGSATSYLPDPFCQLSSGAGTVVGATAIVADTLSPRWNEAITPTPVTAAQLMSPSTPWAISVEDDDGRGASEPACRVAPQLTTNDFASTDLSFNNVQSCLTLTVRLVCQP